MDSLMIKPNSGPSDQPSWSSQDQAPPGGSQQVCWNPRRGISRTQGGMWGDSMFPKPGCSSVLS